MGLKWFDSNKKHGDGALTYENYSAARPPQVIQEGHGKCDAGNAAEIGRNNEVQIDGLRTRAAKAGGEQANRVPEKPLPESEGGTTQPKPNAAGKIHTGDAEPKSGEQAESGGAGDRTNQTQESARGDFSLEQPTAASLEAHEQRIADEISITMTLKPEHLELLKDSPFMLIRWGEYAELTDRKWMDHLHLARKQRVARYCLTPCWIEKAQRYPGGEQAYWNKFSAGGIMVLPEASTPFSLAELKEMTCMEVVMKMRKMHTHSTAP